MALIIFLLIIFLVILILPNTKEKSFLNGDVIVSHHIQPAGAMLAVGA